VRRLIGPFLLLAAGCSGFAPVTPQQVETLRGSDETFSFTRCKFRMSVDSAWLTGEFDGVAVATGGSGSPAARVQVFGDLGPKVLDVASRPHRIVGYFPQTMEGVDCALPDEAAPHLLLFLGATVLEDLLPFQSSRIVGIRTEEEGTWLRLKPVLSGVHTDLLRAGSGELQKRRFSWIYGIGWEETRIGAEEWRITAPRIDIRVKVVERDHAPPAKLEVLDLTLPSEVRLSRGSRK